MKVFIVLLALVLLTGCSFSQTRHDVNDAFKAEKQVVQDVKKWALELQKERATKLGVMNAVSNVFKMSAEYNQTIVMLTTQADKDKPEYKMAYDLVLYLKALGFGARDILLAMIGDSVSLYDAIALMLGG
jgi:hypothetical protein